MKLVLIISGHLDQQVHYDSSASRHSQKSASNLGLKLSGLLRGLSVLGRRRRNIRALRGEGDVTGLSRRRSLFTLVVVGLAFLRRGNIGLLGRRDIGALRRRGHVTGLGRRGIFALVVVILSILRERHVCLLRRRNIGALRGRRDIAGLREGSIFALVVVVLLLLRRGRRNSSSSGLRQLLRDLSRA